MKYKEYEEYSVFTSPQELHKAINTLKGLLTGIQVDSKINEDEVWELAYWCKAHRHLENKHPFKEILPFIDDACEDGIITAEEASDILWLCNNITSPEKPYYDAVTSSLQQLSGIITGIMADGHIDDAEIYALRDWMAQNNFLSGSYPFDEIESLISSILLDGKIDESEREMLTAFLGNFIDTSISVNINQKDLDALKQKYSISGICSVCQDITFADNVFCFTGQSNHATRSDIAQIITEHGGIFKNNVTKKTRYLIVGVDGNPCWAYSCYGRKIEEAVNLRKNGQKLSIVSEIDFWDILEDL